MTDNHYTIPCALLMLVSFLYLDYLLWLEGISMTLNN